MVAILHLYEHVRGRPGFPESTLKAEDGRELCSWRLTIQGNPLAPPYLQLPWRSPLNQSIDTEQNRKGYAVSTQSPPSMYTEIFALVCPGTAFTEFETGKGKDTGQVQEDAILLLDCKNHIIHWMEPGDIDVGPLESSDREQGFGFLEPNLAKGFIVAFADGAVWWIRKDVPQEVILPFLTLDGARTHNRDDELAKYALKKLPPFEKRDGHYVVPSDWNDERR
jgi:hypothetical protein